METAESSPSPSKRRNRKKGGQRDADAAQETAAAVSPIASPSSMEVATGDLISLPSPVARAATDVFETAEHKKMEEQLGGLSLNTHDLKPPQEMPPIIQVETKAEPPPKLDGLLQLSLHQSSGRVPRTPPSSPETFMVHSPDKGYPRVSPVSPDIQVPSTMEDTFMGNTVTTEGFSAVAEQAEVEEFFDEIWPVAESEGTVGAGVEQETASLSNTLADMTLTNTDVPSNGFAQAEAPIQMPDEAVVAVNDAAFTSKDAFEVSSHTTEECVQNTVSVQDSLSGGVVPCAPVVEKPVEISSRQPPMASNGTASMSPLPVNQVTSTSEMANSAVSGTSQTSKPTMKVNQPAFVSKLRGRRYF
ncbi:hypothetical protein PHYBOEH_003173 [Phytophthora boehmeriae]|uniref:Uncharacterized protein n=1 Tax=Phytophthora boehmeriae TaxID=109152 RepID=A0A8T1WQM9_9STRA|nr:hypothetical protein PHYBOEH_003173 [Phytophthora boehmeriae]